jgi:hypothetical protein
LFPNIFGCLFCSFRRFVWAGRGRGSGIFPDVDLTVLVAHDWNVCLHHRNTKACATTAMTAVRPQHLLLASLIYLPVSHNFNCWFKFAFTAHDRRIFIFMATKNIKFQGTVFFGPRREFTLFCHVLLITSSDCMSPKPPFARRGCRPQGKRHPQTGKIKSPAALKAIKSRRISRNDCSPWP